ncbi:hypothetical protein EXS70_01300 [Candidatus Peribacteria bacterium]|nr:hypothetical protein [Candidatus Peribacteria bacterium]
MERLSRGILIAVKHVPAARQRFLFVLILLAAGVMLLWRIGNLLPLYTNAHLRADIRTTLVTVTDREGWLLSNVSLRAVSFDELTIVYRDHHSGFDPETCYTILMKDASLHPCD